MAKLLKSKKANGKYRISPITYRWTYLIMKTLFKVFKLTLRSHGHETAWGDGQIFLFNHFARFEALIPQFLIYQKTGLFSRSIASKELFDDNLLARYLIKLGGIPNDADELLYHVSKDILHDHKLVAFPEGGIVKDRRSVDNAGRYLIYSRSHNERRKLHTGPAVIALAIAIFKSAVRKINESDEHHSLTLWADELGFNDKQSLVDVCMKPTVITPCNITFYPLRISGNALKTSVQFFLKNLPQRLSEELLIEGNFLLKNTDMDIQIGGSIIAEDYWSKLDSAISMAFIKNSELSLREIFDKTKNKHFSDAFLFRLSYQRNTYKIRDAYMHTIYDNVTINIAHIASSIIMRFLAKGEKQIEKRKLHLLIYLTIKKLQQEPFLKFHRTLQNPSIYRNLLMTSSETFNQFLKSAYQASLLANEGLYYSFTDQIRLEHDFDAIRYKNPIAVYANEVSQIPAVNKAVNESLLFKLETQLNFFANNLFDDELRELKWDLEQVKTNRLPTNHRSTEAQQYSSQPFRLIPDNSNGECVVLIHGLLSTPEEMIGLGEKLLAEGYIVIGSRLKGHGTTPWDLSQRNWKDWRQSVRQSIKIAHCYSKKVHLVGFSTGSLLALMMAANRNLNIASVVACSTPMVFKDPYIHLLKIVHVLNTISQKIGWSKGIMPFKENIPEHPQINYQQIPVAAVHQLFLLISKTKARLKKLDCPVLLLQGDNDPVVDASSIDVLLKHIRQPLRSQQWISSDKHGILYENTDNCQQRITGFIKKQSN